MERENDVAVLYYACEWKDFGTCNTLTEYMQTDVIGDVCFDDACENARVVNELSVPVVTMGLKDVVAAASPEGIFVANKASTDQLKSIVDGLERQLRPGDVTFTPVGCKHTVLADTALQLVEVQLARALPYITSANTSSKGCVSVG